MPEDAKQLVQQQFGAHAAGYVNSPTHAEGYSLNRLIELLNPQPGQRALDIATGGGHTAKALARSGPITVAGDITHPMLLAARDFIALPNVTYTRLDAEKLPFPTHSFDIVTCRIAPHHFPNAAEFVREMGRVVKPGGLICLIDQLSPAEPKAARYVNAFERLRDPSHVWAYSAGEWQGFFTGLDILHFEEFETHHNLTPWAERMGNDAVMITRLRAMLAHAPKPVAAWMKPEIPGTADATFYIHQFLLLARKPS